MDSYRALFFSPVLLLFGISLAAVMHPSSSDSNNDAATKRVRERPNVIYIMADDLTTQAISAYGDIYRDIAPTPNMDRLAAEGMLFNDVMCTNAICGPSRAAILTGKYSHQNGYYKNESGGKFNVDQWTFPRAFQDAGYQTALFGKWHLGTDPTGFDAYKFHANAGQQGTYWDPLYNENGEQVREKGYATNLTTDFALNWLSEERKQADPFLMLLQYKAPHRPWEPDSKYETLWDDIDMPYPTTFNDNYEGRELTAGDTEMTMEHLSRRDMKLERPEGLSGKDRIRWDFYGAKNDEIVQPEGMTAEEGRKWRYQRYIKDYLACVKSVDDNIGRVLDYLDKNNLTENTIVILTSDQGFYLGDHGFFDKRFIYEESLRMPFMVRYPKLVKAGTVNDDVITNVDFAPTLLDLAGVKTEEEMQGNSFATMLYGKTPRKWRQSMYYHYYEFPFWHHVQPHYGIRTQRYTMAHFYYSIDKWELYDNQEDPDQLVNLIDNPAYQDIRRELAMELKQLMIEYGNDLPLEEFREITEKDFGSIVDKPENEENVEDIINKKQ
jgi:arylsulfatase A-like enzyme